MGLTTWAGERVRKTDVVISKNYLLEAEITELNRLTTMFLDFAEDRAQRRSSIVMEEWVTQTDRFLDFNERDVLSGSGRVSAERMRAIVGERYVEFDERRRALEAERAASEELDDLRALTALEQRRDEPDEDGESRA